MSFVPYEDLRKNFSIAIGFGLIGTIVFTFGNFNPLLSMAPPILAMVFYFLWFRDKSKLQSQIEQFADSFYYLGFLFTLGALAISLVPWAFDSADVTPENVISKLGIALLTTIIGLGGRVYLTQFLVSEEEAIADIQQKLRDGSRSLATELDLIIETFQGIREKSAQELAAVVESSGDALNGAVAHATNKLSVSLGEFNESIGRLSENIEDTDETLSALKDSVRSLSTSTAILKAELGKVAKQTSDFQKQFDGTLESLDILSKKTEKVLNRVSSLSSAEEDIQGLKGAIRSLVSSIGEATSTLKTSSNELDQMASRATAHANQLDERTKQHEQAVDRTVDMLQKTQASISEAVKITTDRLDVS